jgi:pimeloyl-ACP methyl ester carboxylesterase
MTAGPADRAAGSLARARDDISRSRRFERGALIIIHGGPGVADMADDAPAFAPLATDRGVYVYDGIGTGASSRGTR